MLLQAVLTDLIIAHRDRRVLNRSIAILHLDARAREATPEAHTRLAVAYALRAVVADDPLDRLRALDHTLRAAQDAPDSPVALFNRAVLLADAGLIREARDAWTAYLEIERDAGWREEGAARLAALDASGSGEMLDGTASEKTVVLSDPQRVREMAADSLLPAWGDQMLRRASDSAAATLAYTHALANNLLAATGEESISSAVALIERADAPTRLALARAHKEYGQARALFLAGRADASVPFFQEAGVGFRDAGAEFDSWADLHIAVATLYRQGDAAVRHLAERVQPRGALGGLAARAAGLAEARQGRYASALRSYQRAFTLFENGNEFANLAACRFLIGETRLLLGETQEGWGELLGALAMLGVRRPTLMLQNVLHLAGSEASRLGLHATAAAVHSEGVRVADSTGRVHDLPEAWLRLARTWLSQRNRTAAAAALAAADSSVGSIPDAALRARLAAEADEVRALVGLHDDAGAAVRDAGKAVAYYRAMQLRARLIDALAVRAAAWLEVGDSAEARSDLDSAVVEFETALADVDDPLLRGSLVDVAMGAADRLAALQLDLHQHAEALATLDRIRSLSALSTSRKSARGGQASRPGTDLPPSNEATLVYAHLPDRVVLWTATQNGARLHTIAAPPDEIVSLIDRAEAASSASDTAAARLLLAALHAKLIAPAEIENGITRLTIVADGALHRVPFAALVASDGSFLVERYVLRFAATFADARSPWRAPLPDRPSALFVAPAATSAAFPELRAVRDEIDTIMPLYPVRTYLAREEATPAAFLAALPHHDVVHFAGHALGNGSRPYTAHLLLAADAAGAGSVRVPEVARLDLSRIALVVLAACSTAEAATAQRHGAFSSLAAAFVGAGAHAVVGSLWPVDDPTTATLLSHFHRFAREGADPALALALAQRSMLRDTPDQLATWAAFRVQQ